MLDRRELGSGCSYNKTYYLSSGKETEGRRHTEYLGGGSTWPSQGHSLGAVECVGFQASTAGSLRPAVCEEQLCPLSPVSCDGPLPLEKKG